MSGSNALTARGRSLAGTTRRLGRRLVRRCGFDVVRYQAGGAPIDLDDAARATIRAVEPYTMTSPERVGALIEAVRYVVRAQIPGAVVECGVWRGGSTMAAARTFVEAGATDRDLYLLDTFEGMTEPTDVDRDVITGAPASDTFEASKRVGAGSDWCYAPLEEVRANMARTGYPTERLHFVKGLVEETVPGSAPDQIAILRLDTDWYESTRHELEHLVPRVSPGGVVIIDDYGSWEGARKAVDEYLASSDLQVLLSRIDKTGRMFTIPVARIGSSAAR